MKIYVVTGSQCEYSDYTEWYIAAFTVRSEADQCVEFLKAWHCAHGFEWFDDRQRLGRRGFTRRGRDLPETPEEAQDRKRLDPLELIDHCGSEHNGYEVEEVELLDAIPLTLASWLRDQKENGSGAKQS